MPAIANVEVTEDKLFPNGYGDKSCSSKSFVEERFIHEVYQNELEPTDPNILKKLKKRKLKAYE
jgi:hypothetical protein